MKYMITPVRSMRIPEALEADARAGSPELAGLGIGELVRAALALAAGYGMRDAVKLAHGRHGVRLLSGPPDGDG
jgi:hypothetical protein